MLLTLRPALPADTSCPEQSSRFAGGQTGFVQMKQQNNPIPRINVCIFNKPQNAVVSRHKDQLIGSGDDHILDTWFFLHKAGWRLTRVLLEPVQGVFTSFMCFYSAAASSCLSHTSLRSDLCDQMVN